MLRRVLGLVSLPRAKRAAPPVADIKQRTLAENLDQRYAIKDHWKDQYPWNKCDWRVEYTREGELWCFRIVGTQELLSAARFRSGASELRNHLKRQFGTARRMNDRRTIDFRTRLQYDVKFADQCRDAGWTKAFNPYTTVEMLPSAEMIGRMLDHREPVWGDRWAGYDNKPTAVTLAEWRSWLAARLQTQRNAARAANAPAVIWSARNTLVGSEAGSAPGSPRGGLGIADILLQLAPQASGPSSSSSGRWDQGPPADNDYSSARHPPTPVATQGPSWPWGSSWDDQPGTRDASSWSASDNTWRSDRWRW